MITAYHGTSRENALNICKCGFHSQHRIWLCSNNKMTYFYCDKHNNEDELSAAISSAQIAAAHTCSQSSEVCVFAVKMSDDIFEEYFSDDTSCENTDNCWCIESASLNKLIQDNKIAISLLTMQDAYNPYLRIFYLNHLSDQYYNKPYDDSMFESAKRITQRFDYIDDIYDYGKIDEIKLNT